ncbi:unnamed protein product [Clavelina lepadiformis]|uniref:AAA+ ATPase domain-containing protein n=1 Tax=Clavelina lepadiformis TaxID=159417 RepID=A0ABP0FHW6_CLALP
MLSAATSILYPQVISPVLGSTANVAFRFNPNTKCLRDKISQKTRNEKQKAPLAQSTQSKVDFLPCYLDRMMPLTTCISNFNQMQDSNKLKNHSTSLQVPYFYSSYLTSLWFQQSVRTFKVHQYSYRDVEQATKKEGVKQNQEDVISNALKQLAKSLEKTNDSGNKSSSTAFPKILFIVSTIIAALFITLILRVAQRYFGKFGKSVEDTGVITNVTFDDIRGADEVKTELTDIIGFLQNPSKYTDMGAKLPKGILLVGPPGTGKTLLAKAVAGEAGVPFFYASGSEFDEMFVGVGAMRVRQLFEKARRRAPAIIFLDEIDACGGKRADTTTQPFARQTINQLLQEMDGFSTTDTVIVLAATNDGNVLDRALTRPGRFDTKVEVHLPDIKGRREIIQLYIDKLNSVASDQIDFDRLASLTVGMTGADLSNLVNQAALHSIKQNKERVDQEDLEFALDKIKMGPEMKSRVRTEKDLRTTAYHEAGHALVAYHTPAAHKIYKATIMRRGAALGHVSFMLTEDDEVGRTKAKLLAHIDVAMGGRVAEELVFGPDNVGTGASQDISSATETAYNLVCEFGMSEKMGPMRYSLNDLSPETKRIVEGEVKLLLDKAYAKAKKLLTTKVHEHKLLTEALLRYETLAMSEISLLLESKDLNAVSEKRKRELIQKRQKNIERRNSDFGLTAPVIEYIPSSETT